MIRASQAQCSGSRFHDRQRDGFLKDPIDYRLQAESGLRPACGLIHPRCVLAFRERPGQRLANASKIDGPAPAWACFQSPHDLDKLHRGLAPRWSRIHGCRLDLVQGIRTTHRLAGQIDEDTNDRRVDAGGLAALRRRHRAQ